MSGLYASFESIHTSSWKQIHKNPKNKQMKKNTTHTQKKINLIQNLFLFNILEGEDYLFHGYLFPDSKAE